MSEQGLYSFPATKFVSNSLARQWWHLLTEVFEIGVALLRGELQHAATETWDVRHSAETLHRILSGKGADVVMAREEVISNNMDRGYYFPECKCGDWEIAQGHNPACQYSGDRS